ncbi:MAG: MipA/OmpV family protein [Burkholderiaceae bacterium]|nr:MAG: MipA/OmpV family protein [Burkholderiaceae bacterium]
MPNLPALPILARRPASALITQAASILGTGAGHRKGAIPVMTTVTAMQAVLATTFLVLSPLVQAQSLSQEPAYGLSGGIGLGMASVPTYEGSPNRRTLAGPDLTLRYRSRDWGTVEFGQRGLFWNAVEAGPFRFALVAQFDPGRKDRDTSTLNPTPGDKRLAGMGSVSSATEAGLGIGYGPLMVVARQSLSERGPKGTQVDMTVEMPWSVSDRFALRFALGATWASRDYMQTYFGVTATQAQATSFTVYAPKSGCRKVEANVGAEYALASSWKLQANVACTQLGDVAAASPLVARRNAASAALAVAYEF